MGPVYTVYEAFDDGLMVKSNKELINQRPDCGILISSKI